MRWRPISKLEIWEFVLAMSLLPIVSVLRELWEGLPIRLSWLGVGAVGSVIGAVGMSRARRKKSNGD
jgi:hypothetical protein